MNAKQQKEDIYGPISSMAGDLVDKKAWRQWFRDFTASFSGEGLISGRWISWRAALVAISVQLVLLGLFKLAMTVRKFRRARRSDNETSGGQTSGVDFYRRLETILAQVKCRRKATQTQREFALAAGGQLADQTLTQGVARLPRHVVEAFYRVRFGHRRLDKFEAEQVERALSELEDVIGQQAGATVATATIQSPARD